MAFATIKRYPKININKDWAKEKYLPKICLVFLHPDMHKDMGTHILVFVRGTRARALVVGYWGLVRVCKLWCPILFFIRGSYPHKYLYTFLSSVIPINTVWRKFWCSGWMRILKSRVVDRSRTFLLFPTWPLSGSEFAPQRSPVNLTGSWVNQKK